MKESATLALENVQEDLLHKIASLAPEDEWAQGLILNDEWANSLTHGIGLILSLIGVALLVQLTLAVGDHWKLINFLVYGMTLIILYSASTIYHSLKQPRLKKIFRTVDHCAIYLLIAGSYTPFTMLVLEDAWGWILFGLVWGLACVGIIFKIFFTHRFKVFSTVVYLMMGWMVVIVAEPMMQRLSYQGIGWLLACGLCYTCGVIFYALDKRRFYHAIWHLFVMGGSACHYIVIFFYI